jgi:hypothetical protein
VFDESGQLVDERTRARVAELLAGFVEYIGERRR